MEKLEHLLFEDSIKPHLSLDDDLTLWLAFLNQFNVELDTYRLSKKNDVFLQIGCCSHWLRPHQTRLTVAGGFAYPVGYDKTISYGVGLPKFDWSEKFVFDKSQEMWLKTEKFFGKRKLVCRVAIPSRTNRHNQAAIHLLWSPGTPETPDQKCKLFYGFRKRNKMWECTASQKL